MTSLRILISAQSRSLITSLVCIRFEFCPRWPYKMCVNPSTIVQLYIVVSCTVFYNYSLLRNCILSNCTVHCTIGYSTHKNSKAVHIWQHYTLHSTTILPSFQPIVMIYVNCFAKRTKYQDCNMGKRSGVFFVPFSFWKSWTSDTILFSAEGIIIFANILQMQLSISHLRHNETILQFEKSRKLKSNKNVKFPIYFVSNLMGFIF